MPENNQLAATDRNSDIPFLDVAILVYSRKGYVLIPTVLATFLTFAGSFLLAERFTASTLVIPPIDPLPLSLLLTGASSSDPLSSFGGNAGIQESGEEDVALLHTRSIQDALISRFNLIARYGVRDKDEAGARLRTRSKIVLGRKDGLIDISVEDSDPKLAADLANGYATEFQTLIRSLAASEARQRKIALQQQLIEARQQLRNNEAALVLVQNETGLIAPGAQTASMIHEAFLLRDRVASKEVEIDAMSSSRTENNPAMVQARHELAALQGQLKKMTASQDQIDSGLLASTGELPLTQMRYAQAWRDLRNSQAYFDGLTYMLEGARQDEIRQGALVQVADPAKTPDKHTFPQRLIITACATLTVFFFVLCTLFAREGVTRSPRILEACAALRSNIFVRQTGSQTTIR